MPRYQIVVKEIHIAEYIVDASTREEALTKHDMGESTLTRVDFSDIIHTSKPMEIAAK
jgi:hypothetical protein